MRLLWLSLFVSSHSHAHYLETHTLFVKERITDTNLLLPKTVTKEAVGGFWEEVLAQAEIILQKVRHNRDWKTEGHQADPATLQFLEQLLVNVSTSVPPAGPRASTSTASAASSGSASSSNSSLPIDLLHDMVSALLSVATDLRKGLKVEKNFTRLKKSIELIGGGGVSKFELIGDETWTGSGRRRTGEEED